MQRTLRRLAPYAAVTAASIAAAAWTGHRAAEGQQQTVNRAAADLRRVTLNEQLRLRDSQVAGCHRTLLDRADAIRGWTAARNARLETARNPAVTGRERLQAAAAAAVYGDVISGYRSRIIDCEKAFPPVRIP